MEVTDELVDKLANLSKLEFENEQKQEIKKDLQRMIEFINKLQEVNTDNVAPLLHISDNINVMRADKAESVITKQEALKNSSQANESFFKVPKVIKKEK